MAIRSLMVVGMICLISGPSGCRHGVQVKSTSDVRSTTRTVDQSLDEVCSSFKAHSDTCLRLKEGQLLFKNLKIGMSRQEVHRVLGEPDTKGHLSKWMRLKAG